MKTNIKPNLSLYTRRITPKRVTSYWDPSPRHSAMENSYFGASLL